MFDVSLLSGWKHVFYTLSEIISEPHIIAAAIWNLTKYSRHPRIYFLVQAYCGDSPIVITPPTPPPPTQCSRNYKPPASLIIGMSLHGNPFRITGCWMFLGWLVVCTSCWRNNRVVGDWRSHGGRVTSLYRDISPDMINCWLLTTPRKMHRYHRGFVSL